MSEPKQSPAQTAMKKVLARALRRVHSATQAVGPLAEALRGLPGAPGVCDDAAVGACQAASDACAKYARAEETTGE